MQQKKKSLLLKFSLIAGVLIFVIMRIFIAIPKVHNRPEIGEVARDVTYGTVGGVSLKMDVYYPKKDLHKPRPAVLFVHGGGWVKGDKSGAGIRDFAELVNRGYLVASVNYRLAPEYRFPAQIEDVKCAVRYLRAHAEKYAISPEKIGAFGGSAGGHLVLLLGLSDDSSGFEHSGGYYEQSSRVRAVVDLFGPADLTPFQREKGGLIEQIFGNDPDMLKRASPVNYISEDDPPFLIIHGEKDKLVPFNQSQELYDRLKKAGLTATLVKVKNGGHGFIPQGGKIEPAREEITRMIADFFDQYLK